MKSTRCSTASTRAPSAPNPSAVPGEARQYDFSREMRIVRGRMPTLEMVNERFARQLRVSLYNLLRRTVEIVGGAGVDEEVQRVHALADAADQPEPREDQSAARHRRCSSSIRSSCSRWSTTSSAASAATRRSKAANSRATEMRVVHMLLRSAFADMKEAWTPIAKIDVEYVQLGNQPQFRQHRHALGSRGGVPVPDRSRRRRRLAAHRACRTR